MHKITYSKFVPKSHYKRKLSSKLRELGDSLYNHKNVIVVYTFEDNFYVIYVTLLGIPAKDQKVYATT